MKHLSLQNLCCCICFYINTVNTFLLIFLIILSWSHFFDMHTQSQSLHHIHKLKIKQGTRRYSQWKNILYYLQIYKCLVKHLLQCVYKIIGFVTIYKYNIIRFDKNIKLVFCKQQSFIFARILCLSLSLQSFQGCCTYSWGGLSRVITWLNEIKMKYLILKKWQCNLNLSCY